MAGSLTLAADPSSPMMAATRQWVEGAVNRAGGPFLPVAGGTLVGPLLLSGDPSSPLGAATQQYVDGAITRAGGPFLQVTGGSLSGNLTVGGATALNAAVTMTGPLTITNVPGRGYNFTTTVTDPVVEVVTNQLLTNIVITSDNAQDVLNAYRSHINTNGFTFSSHHSPGLYGEGSAIDTVPGGTCVYAVGVIGTAGNNGLGNVTNAIAVMAHADYGNNITNAYGFYQEAPTRATNKYGAFFTHPVGVGTSAPVGDIEVRAGDALSTHRLLRIRNNAGSLLDIMADGKIGFGGVTPVARPNVTGSWAGNVAGKALAVALGQLGLITDGTTA